MNSSVVRISPRKELLSPQLTRPDWNKSAFRDHALMWLDKNENLDTELLQSNAELVFASTLDSINTYPDSAPLYLKLANWVGIRPSNLLLTAGSDGAIRAVFEAFISPGDVVLHSSPTFAMYPVYCQLFGAVEIKAIYRKSDEGPKLTAEELIDLINLHRPRLFCLPNPDSPSGTAFDLTEIEKMIAVCNRVGSMVLVDEAYHPFSELTVVPLIASYENLIVARTFAKAWGLAGLRIGYAVASEGVANYLHKTRPMYEVNTLAVNVLIKALGQADVMEKSVKRLNAGKNYFLSEMKRLGFKVIDSYGNFLHVNFGSHGVEIHKALSEVVLYRLDSVDECLAGYSRFSSTTKENFAKIVSVIEVAMRKAR